MLPAAYIMFRSKFATLSGEETIRIVGLEVQLAGNKVDLCIEIAQYLIIFLA